MSNYRQYDARWGHTKYPKGNDNVANSGCGPTACADLISIINKKVTPKVTAKFMVKHGYAIPNAGTAHAGIPACLKHFGVDAKFIEHMKDFFKKGTFAVILFRGGTKGGVTWTNGGHYVACVDVKKKGKKHYLKIYDPGPRKNDGWFCYEDTMKGLIIKAWEVKLPMKATKK